VVLSVHCPGLYLCMRAGRGKLVSITKRLKGVRDMSRSVKETYQHGGTDSTLSTGSKAGSLVVFRKEWLVRSCMIGRKDNNNKKEGRRKK
jgi:hypothetical protein